MPFDPNQPYNELPDLPPKAEIETKAILKACNEANKAIARLNAEVQLLPNPSLLLPTISLLEAKDSTEIENIVTTEDKLFQYAFIEGDPTDAATKEAIRYQQAIWDGFRGLKKRPLNANTALDVCKTIKGAGIDIRRVTGTTITNKRKREVIYTPPTGEDLIRAKLANWERYLHDPSDVDPLIRMAVQHYQFEAIHPFPDGNGRTGRVLNILFLVEQGVLDLPVLYLSREILDSRSDYYELLMAVTSENAWEHWIMYVLAITGLSAARTMAKLSKLRILMLNTRIHILQVAPRSKFDDIISLIFSRPYCRITNVVDKGIAKRQTASEYLQVLVRAGVLDEIQVGREKSFVNQRLRLLLADRDSEVMEYSQNALERPIRMFLDAQPSPTAQTS